MIWKRLCSFVFQKTNNSTGIRIKLFKIPVYRQKKKNKTKEYYIIKSSENFNAEWYKLNYGLKSKEDAVEHYLHIGWKKGYAPSLKFDGEKYLATFPDVKAANFNPLLHWEVYGKKEVTRFRLPVGEAKLEFYTPVNYIHKTGKKNVLLVSHLLNHTGAPILLLETAKMLLSSGYNVYVLSPVDGDLRNQFTAEGIPVFICVECLTPTWSWKQLPLKIDFCLCNTIMTWAVYANISKSVSTIWWVHENISPREVTGERGEIIRNAPAIYVPGSLTAKYFTPYNNNVRTLPYPIKDRLNKENYNTNKKIRFSVLGVFSPRKAQDLFVHAINLLPESLLEHGEFEIIGDDLGNEYGNNLRKLLKDSGRVSSVKPITNTQQYHEYVSSLDVVCCPSTEDPFPLVVIDGMMHGKLCVVSDKVGQSRIINHAKDGYVFPSGDKFSLAKIIEEILLNRQQLSILQQNSRLLFEREFDFETSKQLLSNIIENNE